MKKRKSERDELAPEEKNGTGDTEPQSSNGRKALRVPKLKEGEGIVDLLPEEEAFIQEEIASRVELEWSQEKVADAAGLHRSIIQNLEHRRRSLSYRVATLISRAFGFDLEDFSKKSRRWLAPARLLFSALSQALEM